MENNMFSWTTETKTHKPQDDDFTEITLHNKYGEYVVRVPRGDLLIGEMFDDVVKPVLLAAGYQRESIENWIS